MRYLSFFILAVIPVLFMSFSTGWQNQSTTHSNQEIVFCTAQYDPVCGVDGVTYGNACVAGKVEIVYTGECALPDLQYCAAYFDGCNNCSVWEDGLAACTLMYCETPWVRRCTAFIDTVQADNITIFDTKKKQWLSDVFIKLTASWDDLDTANQIKYYARLAMLFDSKVKEWKDFAILARFEPEAYAQFQKKIVYYAYIHFLIWEKLINIR